MTITTPSQVQSITRSGHVAIGVDTHKYLHVAAVRDPVGGILDTLTIPTETTGYRHLLQWASSFGQIIAFDIKGTGSYGAALASFLSRSGHRVVEVNRPDHRLWRLNEVRQRPWPALDDYRSINALAESTIGLFTNEAIQDGSPFRAGPLRTVDDVEWVTPGWVDWPNNRRVALHPRRHPTRGMRGRVLR